MQLIPIGRTQAAIARATTPAFGAARQARIAKAAIAARAPTFTGNTKPAEQVPADVRAIVESAPLTWTYPAPDDVGGWLGGIEPADERWIAFVGVDGKVLLWTGREPDGGVIGLPFLLSRPDLATGSRRTTAGRIIPTGSLVAPRRFRIWGPGDNPGDYGSNKLTPAAAKQVMAEYERCGRALAIDYQHATNVDVNPAYDVASPPPMAGYAELKVIQGAAGPELWADPVRWSNCGRVFAVPGEICCGKHQIETGQRGYISPDWQRTKDTNEPIAINRLALVAEPGTYGINMLASASRTRALAMDDMSILKALLAAGTACASSADTDVQALGQAVAEQTNILANGKGIDLSAPPAQAASEPPPPPAPAAPAAAAADTEKPEDKMAAAVAKGVASALQQSMAAAKNTTAAARGVTPEEMKRALAENDERRELITANKGVLGAMAPILASKPLSEVKSLVAAAVANAATKPASEEPVRGAPVVAPANMTAADKAEVATVAGKMGVDAAKTEAVMAGSGTLEVSLAERYKAKSDALKAKGK